MRDPNVINLDASQYIKVIELNHEYLTSLCETTYADCLIEKKHFLAKDAFKNKNEVFDVETLKGDEDLAATVTSLDLSTKLSAFLAMHFLFQKAEFNYLAGVLIADIFLPDNAISHPMLSDITFSNKARKKK